MVTTAQTRPGVPTRRPGAVPVGVALVVAELLLAVLWFPWVVDHLWLGSSVPYAVARLLIIGPEYALVAIAVHLVARSPSRRWPAVALAVLAGLVVWGWSVLAQHLAHTPAEVAAHRQLLDTLHTLSLVVAPTLAALAWGVAARRGRLWLLAVPLAPALHWWFQHSDWTFRVESHLGFRGSEALGMTLVIVPVLLAVLAGWALEQVETSGSPRPEGPAYDGEGPPPQRGDGPTTGRTA